MTTPNFIFKIKKFYNHYNDTCESELYYITKNGKIILEECDFSERPLLHKIMNKLFDKKHDYEIDGFENSIFSLKNYNLHKINNRRKLFTIESRKNIQMFDIENGIHYQFED